MESQQSALDRRSIGGLTVEQIAYIVLILAAVFLRTYDLGVRPYHHDESIHAFFSWKIFKNGFAEYKYDPVYHGPTLYFSTALMMLLFGDNDFTGRLSAVVFGLGVVAFAWPLRRYIGRWGEFVTALAYLWEGQVRQAESLLRASLPAAEAELGRRSPFVCMLAALLAAAVWEGDRPDEARALLANRLDVLERGGLPEAVLLGYRTMARIAAADGADHRALELLGALHAVGVARGLPRLAIASPSERPSVRPSSRV